MHAGAEDAVRQQVAALYRRGGFRPVARFLPEEQREDRLAEAIGLTLDMALRYASRGQRLPDAILVHHARLRAVDHSRHLVSSKGRGADAMNQANYVAGKVEVLRLDGVADPDGDTCGDGDRQLIGLALNGNPNPADMLASGFDLQRWLAALPERDRLLLEHRASGLSLQEIGVEMGMSLSQAFARCQKLGVELAGAAELSVPRRKRKRRQLH